MQEVLKTFYVVIRREFESHRFRFESRDELVGKITRKFNEYQLFSFITTYGLVEIVGSSPMAFAKNI